MKRLSLYRKPVEAIKPREHKKGKCRGCGGISTLVHCKVREGHGSKAMPWLCYDCAFYASEGDL